MYVCMYIAEFLLQEYNVCLNLNLNLVQTNLLLLRQCLRKVFTTLYSSINSEQCTKKSLNFMFIKNFKLSNVRAKLPQKLSNVQGLEDYFNLCLTISLSGQESARLSSFSSLKTQRFQLPGFIIVRFRQTLVNRPQNPAKHSADDETDNKFGAVEKHINHFVKRLKL